MVYITPRHWRTVRTKAVTITKARNDLPHISSNMATLPPLHTLKGIDKIIQTVKAARQTPMRDENADWMRPLSRANTNAATEVSSGRCSAASLKSMIRLYVRNKKISSTQKPALVKGSLATACSATPLSGPGGEGGW